MTGGPALVLLSVQNELRKVIKYEALSLFRRELNVHVSNFTGAQMLDYIHPMTSYKITLKWYYWREQINTLSLLWTS